mmetsp:Transcript_525/g.872  ORF Transcript_525/g.872 Transcript_525/m.872 type:complete len:163 (-) Transcript_525:33-521(-)|eukprot:CAMPEP_0113628630 /NCGR_PEP_ID=MMETSP0017_2-20120614/14836_1 /TAXON_ID=2856 /ORGANISM="Cylindrotheca closterium" /LENGTH=162 /DNA_ID=CAMNT_0000538945 /DNA_START=82 /DNA_END=570 /DNA_ORIENTATION=- /assembly_acc=CAM_ASM_000147
MLRKATSIGFVFSRSGKHAASVTVPSFGLLSQECSHGHVGAVRHRSNRSKRGLYDGKDIRSGNNVSFSMKSTKRKFKPNVFTKKVYSEILDEMIKFHLTTSTLRSIDNAGGLDNYLLTSKHVASGEGLVVKKRIVSRLKLNEKLEKWKLEDTESVESREQSN